jgi:hypothetical protein
MTDMPEPQPLPHPSFTMPLKVEKVAMEAMEAALILTTTNWKVLYLPTSCDLLVLLTV